MCVCEGIDSAGSFVLSLTLASRLRMSREKNIRNEEKGQRLAAIFIRAISCSLFRFFFSSFPLSMCVCVCVYFFASRCLVVVWASQWDSWILTDILSSFSKTAGWPRFRTPFHLSISFSSTALSPIDTMYILISFFSFWEEEGENLLSYFSLIAVFLFQISREIEIEMVKRKRESGVFFSFPLSSCSSQWGKSLRKEEGKMVKWI